MPRRREYDQDAVLTGAMEAFRRCGYAGVSIKDLEGETGLKAGSIYNSFGDKAGLFRASFGYYVEHVLKARIALHAPGEAGLAGLRRLFVSLMVEPDGGAFGCLITNCAVEFGGAGIQPRDVTAAMTILSETLTARLQAAKSGGELARGCDPISTAIKLLALYQGTLVLVRAQWDKTALEAMVNAEFDRLERKNT